MLYYGCKDLGLLCWKLKMLDKIILKAYFEWKIFLSNQIDFSILQKCFPKKLKMGHISSHVDYFLSGQKSGHSYQNKMVM